MRERTKEPQCYFKDFLNEHEELIFETTTHWSVFFLPAVLAMVAALFAPISPYELTRAFTSSIAIVAGTLSIITFGHSLILFLFGRFALSTEHIFYKGGVFHTNVVSVPLDQIDNLVTERWLLGKYLDAGTLLIINKNGRKNSLHAIEGIQELSYYAGEQMLKVRFSKRSRPALKPAN